MSVTERTFTVFLDSFAVVKHHDQTSSGGPQGLFSSHFHITVHHQRKSGQELKQGRDLEAGADAEAMEGCCIVPCLLLMACSYRTQDHQLRGGTTLSHQLLMKKMSYWLAYSLML